MNEEAVLVDHVALDEGGREAGPADVYHGHDLTGLPAAIFARVVVERVRLRLESIDFLFH